MSALYQGAVMEMNLYTALPYYSIVENSSEVLRETGTNVLHTFQQSHHVSGQQDAGCRLTSGQQAAADFTVL